MGRILQIYLVPAAVIVSVIIGGGYGTGREIVEFFTAYGIQGGLKGLALAGLIFAVVLAATFEFARVFRTYDYVYFFKALIGPFWVLFEILYILLFFLVLGVVSSAAASVLEQEVGLPSNLGLALMLTLVALVVGLGRGMVERILTFWFIVMYTVFIIYFWQMMSAADQSSFEQQADKIISSNWWRGGFLYPMYNLAVVPVLLFSTRHIEHRGEAIGVAAITAMLIVLPALMFHLSYALGYPSVLEQDVPNYWMIAQFANPLLLTAFVIALFGTLVQTGAGLIHGVIERLEVLATKRDKVINRWIRGGIAATALAVSGLLGTLGIVDLIARGYAWMGVGFALIYVLPVCTIGLWHIQRAQKTGSGSVSRS